MKISKKIMYFDFFLLDTNSQTEKIESQKGKKNIS